MNIRRSEQGQAMPAETVQIPKTAFDDNNETAIYWMGNASIFINSHGTDLMIDPLLEGFDMKLLIDMPLNQRDIPKLDALLITHDDNDHFSRGFINDTKAVCKSYHAPKYVAGLINELGVSATGHDINESFEVNDLKITLTPAEHNWKNGSKKYQFREWKLEDYCGFYIETRDGSIWTPGDSKLLESQLHMPNPDVILLDFADNSWHITFDGAVKLANTYPNAELILIHWGSVDAPQMNTFNGDPIELAKKVTNPERIHALAPGEKFVLKKK